MTIAVFSGSFNPVHCGHAMMANFISQFCEVDEVWMMPTPLNPLKTDNPPASFHHRFEMCGIVARKCCNVKVSDFEKDLPQPNYTYRTLCELKKKYPGVKFKLVIGSDNWKVFEKWRDYDKIINEFGLIVYPRPGYEVAGKLPSNVQLLVNAPVALLSSSFLREAIKSNKNLNYMIDPQVAQYIKSNKLYME